MLNVDSAHLDDIEQTTGLQLLKQPGGFTSSYLQIIFNYREGITQDKAVREAVQYAIDKEAINKVVFNGRGDVGCHPLPTEHWAYVSTPCPERDPEKAKQILLDAGYDLPVTLDWVPMFVPFSKVLAQVRQAEPGRGRHQRRGSASSTPELVRADPLRRGVRGGRAELLRGTAQDLRRRRQLAGTEPRPRRNDHQRVQDERGDP